MTVAAPPRDVLHTPEVVHTAAASLAIADALIAPPGRWRVMGASGRGWWVATGDEMIVLSGAPGTRLPNGMVGPPGDAAPGDDVVIGAGMVSAGTTGWRVVRWWDPRVAPVAAAWDEVARRARWVAARVPDRQASEFCAALRAADPDGAVDLAIGLLGSGPGLTPEGDDHLTGAVAGYLHVASSIGDPIGVEVVGATRSRLLAAARHSTSLLSYTLLRHAYEREVPGPVASLLRSLSGRGEPDTALALTLRVGGSSGPAWAAGVAAGALTACGVAA